MIFHKLKKEARRIRLGPAQSAHAARMARDAHIYRDWIHERMLCSLKTGACGAEGGGGGRRADEPLPHVAPTPSTSAAMAGRGEAR